MSYRSVMASLGHSMLGDPYGQAWLRAQGVVLDYVAQRARQSVLQRMPLSAAEDALGFIGTERGIDLGSSLQRVVAEDIPSYRSRVRAAWDLWHWGGTPLGLLRAFGAQGYYPEIVCANGNVYSLAAGGGQWSGSASWGSGTWGAAAESTTELVITTTAPLTTLLWNRFFIWFPVIPTQWTNPVTPPTPSTTPSVYELRRLFDICVKRWAPAWTGCLFIGAQVSGSPGVWGAPGALWGGAGLTWGSSVAIYFPTD